MKKESTYRSAGNVQLDLSPVRAHQLSELLRDALERTQPVVLGKSLEQVLDDAVLVVAQVLLELGHNLLLVLDGEGGRTEHRGELGILLEDVAQRVEALGRGIERVGLRGRSVLHRDKFVSGARLQPAGAIAGRRQAF